MKQNIAGMLTLVDENFVSEADPTQNKPKQKLGWQKLTAIAASICVFISALAIGILIPTMNNNKPPVGGTGLEYGFEFKSDANLSPDFCGIKSDTNQFDIDDVTLDFYFGSVYCADMDENEEYTDGISIPEFDIYFSDSNFNMLYLVRHVEENYISNKYAVECRRNQETGKLTTLYSHSERITIPAELFVDNEGMLGFRLAGINVLSVEPSYQDFNGMWIYYKVDGTRVTLSSHKF